MQERIDEVAPDHVVISHMVIRPGEAASTAPDIMQEGSARGLAPSPLSVDEISRRFLEVLAQTAASKSDASEAFAKAVAARFD